MFWNKHWNGFIMRKKVLVVGLDYGIARMFIEEGWDVTHNPLETGFDLIQFTGGEDVDPSYYNERKHPATHSNPARDAREAAIYLQFSNKVPMAGICRGAQFLNVMNKGSMWQHVTNHAIGRTHSAFDHINQEEVAVTSTHHQMMIAGEGAMLLLSASCAEVKQGFETQELGGITPDVEALYYPATDCLCYQPHPEYCGVDHPCRVKYFEYLETFLGL